LSICYILETKIIVNMRFILIAVIYTRPLMSQRKTEWFRKGKRVPSDLWMRRVKLML